MSTQELNDDRRKLGDVVMSPQEYNRRFANLEISLSVKMQNALDAALSGPCYICKTPRKLIIGFVPNRPTYLHPHRCDLCAEEGGLRPIEPLPPFADRGKPGTPH